MKKNSSKIFGIFGIIFYIFLSMERIKKGNVFDPLWACHLGCLFSGLGVLFSVQLLFSVGFLWLIMGNIYWILFLLGGGEFLFSSFLTHIGGILTAYCGIRGTGIFRNSWIISLGLIITLQILSHFVSPPAENLNLSWSVPKGYEKIFSSYFYYEISLLLQFGAVFYSSERLFTYLGHKKNNA